MNDPVAASDRCPCGSSVSYSECCGPVHAGEPVETAEQLMRSRYSAFVLGCGDYLLDSWHPSTRPRSVSTDDDTAWRRLQIVDVVAGTAADEEGVVEFRATYRSSGGGVNVLHERSRFRRVGGAWKYVDGDILD
ncbi:YchJ family protein [Herbiconiux sp. L3-i23]|uniref:YchJ family protein n=1 Tax=Herbiconiux sp. L3-i23 TaxID=2905871 RepID=UPI0020615824|nr:YchJ family metal-binding protein [Herbiconiux sp. L3-i23]BDI22884.1 UPF0225 protein [Herbiconiux sp. L3-i23]